MRTLILVLFTACVLIAASLIFIDPITGEGWHGVVSLLAAGALGFPWSLVLLFLPRSFLPIGATNFLLLLWVCVFINYAFLIYAWRKAAKYELQK